MPVGYTESHSTPGFQIESTRAKPNSALGQAFAGFSADPLLVWNYAVTAVVVRIAGVIFCAATRKLDQEENASNDLREGYSNNH